MPVTPALIRELRDRTGAGVMDCKRALEEADGDLRKGEEILRLQGKQAAAKKASRETSQGLVEAYIHAGGKVGAMVELNCETDFVARNPEFKALAHDIAMQIAATGETAYVSPDDVPQEVLARERALARELPDMAGRSPAEVEQAVERHVEKMLEHVCLLKQPFIKDQAITIQDLVTACIAKFGENIRVRRFARFQLGD